MLAQRSVVRADSSPQPLNSSAAEQKADMDLLASQLVEKLKHADIKTVALSRFYGKKAGRPLADALSGNFISAFAKTTGDIHILDRAELVKGIGRREVDGHRPR